MGRVWRDDPEPNYGDDTEMTIVNNLIHSGDAEAATTKVHERYPWMRPNVVGVLVRKARRMDRASKRDVADRLVREFLRDALNHPGRDKPVEPSPSWWQRLLKREGK
jgi:hypothetical protein